MADNGPITVVTPTVGNGSPRRLDVLLSEMRQFTRLPYTHIVCDDGTISEDTHAAQREVCERHGAIYLQNNGPIYGAAYALNIGFGEVTTPWAYLVDDGVRPGLGWLEAAVDFVENIGSKRWHGYSIGLAGALQIPLEVLGLSGVLPPCNPLFYKAGHFQGTGHTSDCHCIRNFYGLANDGLWCLGRLVEQMSRRLAEESMELGMSQTYLHTVCDNPLVWGGDWPRSRLAHYHIYGEPLALIKMEAFRAVGGFRDQCWLYEGHLGIRLGKAGYLSLTVEMPPWLHLNCQASLEARTDGKQPRPAFIDEIFQDDFGINSQRAPLLVDKVIGLKERMAINRELSRHPLKRIPDWQAWE